MENNPSSRSCSFVNALIIPTCTELPPHLSPPLWVTLFSSAPRPRQMKMNDGGQALLCYVLQYCLKSKQMYLRMSHLSDLFTCTRECLNVSLFFYCVKRYKSDCLYSDNVYCSVDNKNFLSELQIVDLQALNVPKIWSYHPDRARKSQSGTPWYKYMMKSNICLATCLKTFLVPLG